MSEIYRQIDREREREIQTARLTESQRESEKVSLKKSDNAQRVKEWKTNINKQR